MASYQRRKAALAEAKAFNEKLADRVKQFIRLLEIGGDEEQIEGPKKNIVKMLRFEQELEYSKRIRGERQC